jgi:beta-lactamase class A
VPGSVNFQPGKPGTTLDIDSSVALIARALDSLTQRQVNLPLEWIDPTRPSIQNLGILLRQTISNSGFDGLAGLYLFDLQTAAEVHFAQQGGVAVPVQPDIAFTASSIIKIPIMISAFRRMSGTQDPEAIKLLEDMIDKSGNEAADWLMDRVIDDREGPLLVSEDLHAMGLNSTFLAGYFTPGSPLLAGFETPANNRDDISTDPDPYNQTTPSEIGMLLADLYQCAQSGGGTLIAVFPEQITQAKCQTMINYLVRNKLPDLLTAGLPENTQIAHKHGWVSNGGVIRTIADAGIIYSPGGNYVLAVFLYHPDQLVWQEANALIANISKAVYNYYNLPSS